MVEKCSKGSGDSDADSDEDGADRFARLTSFGSQELRKESRSKSLSEIRLQSELTRLRNTAMVESGTSFSDLLVALTLTLHFLGFRPLLLRIPRVPPLHS